MRRVVGRRALAALLGLGLVAGGLALLLRTPGCRGWDPREPFTHLAPEVSEAVSALEAGGPDRAAELLEAYLGTGACTDGSLGLPERVRQRPDASFDLGLALFGVAERFGKPFGQEPPKPPREAGKDAPPEDEEAKRRRAEISCALILVEALASDSQLAPELRARARYLAGNLEFLRGEYAAAIKHYEQALGFVPGLAEGEGVDGLGRDAAWNRAIAQRRLEEEKAANPPPPPEPKDQQPPPPEQKEEEEEKEPKPQEKKESPEAKGEPKPEEPKDKSDPPPAPSSGAEPPPSGEPDPSEAEGPPQGHAPPPEERILDQLEQAPTYQEQEAKQRATGRRVRTMEDK